MAPVGSKLLLVLVILLPFSYQQSCDSFRGSKELDYALSGYTFDCSTTSDLSSCALHCLSHDRCKSCNYALSGPQRGLCELNSEGRDASTPLQYRPGFVFVQAILKQVGFESAWLGARELITQTTYRQKLVMGCFHKIQIHAISQSSALDTNAGFLNH